MNDQSSSGWCISLQQIPTVEEVCLCNSLKLLVEFIISTRSDWRWHEANWLWSCVDAGNPQFLQLNPEASTEKCQHYWASHEQSLVSFQVQVHFSVIDIAVPWWQGDRETAGGVEKVLDKVDSMVSIIVNALLELHLHHAFMVTCDCYIAVMNAPCRCSSNEAFTKWSFCFNTLMQHSPVRYLFIV